MKHPWQVTLLLVLLFIAAQAVGLFLVAQSISSVQVAGGQVVLQHTTTAIGERPQLQGYESFLYLLLGVLVGTVLLLVLVRFRQVRVWKLWFFLAVFLAQTVAIGVLLPSLIAAAIALLLALWKVYRPNPWVHNLTEVLMYAGIAVLLVPIFDVFWMLMILVAISIYDMIAVWRTKHMVALAQFQAGSSVFAGLMVPKGKEPTVKSVPVEEKEIEEKKASEIDTTSNKISSNTKNKKITMTGTSAKSTKKTAVDGDLQPPNSAPVAILGGGDIAFPLIFSGAVLESLVRRGLTVPEAFAGALIVTATATVALTLLFVFSKKGRFYPAMPFLSLGCVAGWLITLLL